MSQSTPEQPASRRRYALFVGRWQPPHPGHEWLIRQKLDEGTPVLIAVRPTDEYLETQEVVQRLYDLFRLEADRGDVVIFPLPADIESINYGRGVGYAIIEHVPPDDIAEISATKIRQNE
jgi:hypothetical protein